MNIAEPGQAERRGKFNSRHWLRNAFLVLICAALCAEYYFLAVPCTLVNKHNLVSFAQFSRRIFFPEPPPLLGNWGTRVAAPAATSALLDWALPGKEPLHVRSSWAKPYYETCFGLWFAFWLAATLAVLRAALRPGKFLPVALGVFAGAVWPLAKPDGAILMPWDLCAMFFFTAAFLAAERGRLILACLAIVAGSLVKETVLVCLVFILLNRKWKWLTKAPAAIIVIAFFFACQSALVPWAVRRRVVPVAARDPARTQVAFCLPRNLRYVASFDPRSFVWTGAGALLPALALGWRRPEDKARKTALWVFTAGQFAVGLVWEARVFYEVLPLAWVTAMDWWQQDKDSVAAVPPAG
jgi:hypothetical protein